MSSVALPWIERFRAQLPHGRTLPRESWKARHRVILAVALFHAFAVPTYGIALGFPVGHCLLEGSAVAALVGMAWLAGREDRTRIASSAAAVSLMTSSGLVVHLSSGQIEAHFHFFVMIVVLTLYEDWVPFLVSLGYVVLHHGVAGVLDPEAIYSHAPGQAHPLRFALIHGAFVAAAGAAGVYTWKHNEEAREQALRAQSDADLLYRSVVESLNEGLVIQAPDGSNRAVNDSAGRLLKTSAESLERNAQYENTIVREDGSVWPPDEYPSTITARTGKGLSDVVMGFRGASDDVTWLSVSTRPLKREADGWSVVSTLTDVTERRRAQGELQRLADHDTLTGLLNRRRFEEDLTRCMAEVSRYDSDGAVLVLDLDNFKYVNDSLGHAVGDELICRASEAISGRLRASDTLARLGGDEFAVIAPRADVAAAEALAGSLLEVIREEVVLSTVDGPRRTTASVGIAMLAPGQSTHEVMAHADMAMYDAKDRGKDRVAMFDPGGGRQALAKMGLSWAERIRTALEHDRFVLHAQPIVDLANPDGARRFELLVRMRSEAGELIPPGVFLPVAERFDLIRDLDRWVLQRAARMLGELRQRGENDVALAVNLSGRSIDIDMLDLLRSALDHSHGDPRKLTVEITETAAIADLDRAKVFAEGVHAMGCRLALDDFGSGFASFHYLNHLNFDEIKIDGSYVRDMAEDETHQVLVRSLVDIARSMGKETTAEFVSDDASIALLRDFGVHWGQGFHLGMPGPLEEHGLPTGAPAPVPTIRASAAQATQATRV